MHEMQPNITWNQCYWLCYNQSSDFTCNWEFISNL